MFGLEYYGQDIQSCFTILHLEGFAVSLAALDLPKVACMDFKCFFPSFRKNLHVVYETIDISQPLQYYAYKTTKGGPRIN